MRASWKEVKEIKKVTNKLVLEGIQGGRVPRQREWHVQRLRGVGKDGIVRDKETYQHHQRLLPEDPGITLELEKAFLVI